VDTNFFRNYNRDRLVDVFFGASVQESLYGPDRKRIHYMLIDMYNQGFNTEFKTKKYVYGDYVDRMNASKIGVNNNSKFGFMTKKALEIMACGALLLTDKCEEFDEMGIEDGENVVIYNDLNDLQDKIYYYLANNSERERIAQNGYELVLDRFSMRDAARRLVEVVLDV
jgi:spore maturation protein CgeB